MDEGRKRVLGIMAAILAARKLAQQDSTRPVPEGAAQVNELMTKYRLVTMFILKARTKDLAVAKVEGAYLITITKNFISSERF